MFETVSFHIVKPCNKKCKFCYATFNDMHVKMLTLSEAKQIVYKLYKAGVQKITFAGGEPMLYKNLEEIIVYTKRLGITTSLITNGSLLSNRFLQDMQYDLDWIGLSIDSLDSKTNIATGRFISYDDQINYRHLCNLINKYGYKLKINTVVNAFNYTESMVDFINEVKPSRWKIFDTLRVEGQNDLQFDNIKTPPGGFKLFTFYNEHPAMVVEDNQAMTGSYLLVDPQGRLFENSKGKHTYSTSLLNTSVEEALKEISLDRDMFIKRGGIYNW